MIKDSEKLYKFPNLKSKQLAIVKSKYILKVISARLFGAKLKAKQFQVGYQKNLCTV